MMTHTFVVGDRVAAEVYDPIGNSKFISIGWIRKIKGSEISIETCTCAGDSHHPAVWEIIVVNTSQSKNWIRRLAA